MNRLFVLFFVLLAAAALVVTGCSQNSSTTAPTSPTEPPTPIPTSTAVTSPNFTGNLSIKEAASVAYGKQYAVIIDNDSNTANGTTITDGVFVGTIQPPLPPPMQSQIIIEDPDNIVAGYAMSVPDGECWVYALIDMDGSGANGVTGGDFVSEVVYTNKSGNVNVNLDLTRAPYKVLVYLNLPKLMTGKAYAVIVYPSNHVFNKMNPMGDEPVDGNIEGCPESLNFLAYYAEVPYTDGGQYKLLAAIDDGTGGSLQALGSGGNPLEYPKAGDMFGVYGGSNFNSILTSPNININKDLSVTINMTECVNNVSGTLTLPEKANGSLYGVALSELPLDQAGDDMVGNEAYCPDSRSVPYSLYVLFSGNYYITAIVDNMNDGEVVPPQMGEYTGIYGVTPPINWSGDIWPPSPNASLPATGRNITLEAYPGGGPE